MLTHGLEAWMPPNMGVATRYAAGDTHANMEWCKQT